MWQATDMQPHLHNTFEFFFLALTPQSIDKNSCQDLDITPITSNSLLTSAQMYWEKLQCRKLWSMGSLSLLQRKHQDGEIARLASYFGANHKCWLYSMQPTMKIFSLWRCSNFPNHFVRHKVIIIQWID